MNVQPRNKPTLAEQAVNYTKHGWAVFPADAAKRMSYERAAANDCRRWGASTDASTAAALFAKHPNAQVGIATQESRIFVLDLDVKDGVDGVTWLAERITENNRIL